MARSTVSVTPLVLASILGLSAGCAVEVADDPPVDGAAGRETASAGAALELAPVGNPAFICEYGLEMDPSDARRFPYCASKDLADDGVNWSQYRRVIFAQHGRGGDAKKYRQLMFDAGGWAVSRNHIAPGETFVVAPQFISDDEVQSEGLSAWQLEDLIWWSNTSAPWDWTTAGLSSPGQPHSSFNVIDTLVEQVIARMPNLQEIIFTGQSAGGQTTQRYALLGRAVFPRGVRVRFLPVNPFAYTYVNAERPSAYGDGFVFKAPDLNVPHIWPDLDICPELNGDAVPGDYNVYEKGLEQLPAHYLGWFIPPASQVRDRYLARDVTYLVGEADVTHEEQCSPDIQLQGKHRRQRAVNYHAHVQELGGNHGLVVVPDVGHGGQIYEEDCTREVLFGVSSSCNNLPDHEGGENWGDVYGIAFGQIDGDDREELAVIREIFGRKHVVLLNDGRMGYAVRSYPTASWPDGNATSVAFGEVDGTRVMLVGRQSDTLSAFVLYDVTLATSPTVMLEGGSGWDAGSVALGDIDGDGSDELAVTRDATSGTRWYLYRYSAGNLSTVRSGTWAGSARPKGVVFSDVDWDGQDELAVGNDGTSGARIVVLDGLTNAYALVWSVGSNWPNGDRLVGFGFETVDDDAERELMVARSSSASSRWLVLDDRATGFSTVLDEGGAELASWIQPVAFAVGRPAASGTSSFALGYTGFAPERVQYFSFRWLGEDQTPTAGNLEVHGDDLHWNTSVRALAFGDTDGLGGDELAYSIAGDAEHKFHVIAAP